MVRVWESEQDGFLDAFNWCLGFRVFVGTVGLGV